jgi:hypothetical protein
LACFYVQDSKTITIPKTIPTFGALFAIECAHTKLLLELANTRSLWRATVGGTSQELTRRSCRIAVRKCIELFTLLRSKHTMTNQERLLIVSFFTNTNKKKWICHHKHDNMSNHTARCHLHQRSLSRDHLHQRSSRDHVHQRS